MAEELTYEAVDFYDDREELYLDLKAIRRQDDPDIDGKGLRRQQMTVHGVGVIPHYAHIDHPRAIQAQNHVLGPLRRHSVGRTQIGKQVKPVHGLAQVDLVIGHQINTGGSVALPTREVPDELHATDLPQTTLAEALAAEDLTTIASGRAINQVRKGKTTRRMRPIR